MSPVGRARQEDVPMQPVRGPAVWSADDLAARGGWLHVLDEDEIAELSEAADAAAAAGLGLRELDRGRFELSASLAATIGRIRREIVDGPGFVQIRGLPVARFGRRKAATIFWGIARHLGDEIVSQNGRGHLLDHVKDLGQTFRDPSSRGPYTRERIEYHTDACDVVGLLCLQPSASGGESTLASGGAVHNEMLRRRPDLLEALLEPVYRDRREEVPAGREPWYAMPVFNFFKASCRSRTSRPISIRWRGSLAAGTPIRPLSSKVSSFSTRSPRSCTSTSRSRRATCSSCTTTP